MLVFDMFKVTSNHTRDFKHVKYQHATELAKLGRIYNEQIPENCIIMKLKVYYIR